MKKHLSEIIKEEKKNKNLLISLVGGGGKTTTIYQVAKALNEVDNVLITSTTAMFHPKEHVDEIYFKHLPNKAYAHQIIGFYTRFDEEKNKVYGISSEELHTIKSDYKFSYILNEADGSRRKPLKCYADHEPVIPRETDIVIVVIGADAFNQVLSSDYVFRIKEFSQVTGLNEGELVTDEVIIKLLTSELGFLKAIPDNAKAYLLINKSDCLEKVFDKQAFKDKLFSQTDKYDYLIFAEMKENKIIDIYKKTPK